MVGVAVGVDVDGVADGVAGVAAFDDDALGDEAVVEGVD